MEQNPPDTNNRNLTSADSPPVEEQPEIGNVIQESDLEVAVSPTSTTSASSITQQCDEGTFNVPASSSTEDIPPPKVDYYAPPPYEVATKGTKLPTYEEVQMEKHLEEQDVNVNPSLSPRPPPFRQIGHQRIIAIENEATDDVDTTLLGTDFMFYIAFFVAFIFNWIGFLLLMCFCHTIASRYGALSGFGLSLAKWTFIVQHSTELASKDNSWLWWLIMTFGLIICIRAILQYLSIKRGWHMLSASHQERLLFFY